MKYLFENWQLIAAILGFIGTPIAFVLGRKKAAAETNVVRGDAIASMQKAYDAFVIDSMQQYNEMKIKVKEIEVELQLTRKENIQQRTDIRELRKAQDKVLIENKELKRHIVAWEKKYTNLKRAFEQLKQKYQTEVNSTPGDGK